MSAPHRRVRTPSSISFASTPSAHWRWTPSSKPNPAIRARRWRWRRWPTLSGKIFCALIPPIRSGPIAIASSSQTATHRCCFTRCCIFAASKRSTRNTSARRAGSLARRHQAVSADREQMSRPPGISPDLRRRNDDRSARPGLRQQRRHGVGRTVAGAHFNRPDFAIFDYNVYVICGDGDMMEGVSNEAASFAGHLMLGNLCWFYDSNRVTIEGHTDLAFSDDVAARFLAYGWNVQHASATSTICSGLVRRSRFSSDTEAPDPHHRRESYRLWRAAQARHQRGPRRAPRRRRGASSQAKLRLARRRQISRTGRRSRAFSQRHRQTRQKLARRMARPV